VILIVNFSSSWEVDGDWLLVIGYWLLVSGYWLLVSGGLVAG